MKQGVIDPHESYSLAQIADQKLIPGCRSFTAVKNVVMRDLAGPNVLKTLIHGKGNATRFYISGAAIIKFVKQK